jgi:protein TonB
LGGAVVLSVALHMAAIAIAVLGFGRRVPAAEDSMAITVLMPPAPVAAAAPETAEARPGEAPPPEPDYGLPPPEEQLAIPDFKPPLPPPQPKPAPPKPAVAATARPAPAPAPSPAPSSAPPSSLPAVPASGASVVPGWNAQLTAWLASHKRYPAAAHNRGEQGEVTIRFTVEGDGRVSEASITKSSGHADLDAAALAMLQGAGLPPPGVAATRTVRIHYRLDD